MSVGDDRHEHFRPQEHRKYDEREKIDNEFVKKMGATMLDEAHNPRSKLERAADGLKIAQERLALWEQTLVLVQGQVDLHSRVLADCREALNAAVEAR